MVSVISVVVLSRGKVSVVSGSGQCDYWSMYDYVFVGSLCIYNIYDEGKNCVSILY